MVFARPNDFHDVVKLSRGQIEGGIMATVSEIAAYVGAAAWLPPILFLLYHMFVKPTVVIVPERQFELGYTTYGPIFNLNLALTAKRKDAVIERISVTLTHEDGEVHNFHWVGMTENISQIRDPVTFHTQTIEKVQPAIALKLSTTSLSEKFIRFQEEKFLSSFPPALNRLTEHHTYVKEKKGDVAGMDIIVADEVLESKEFHEGMKVFKECFRWKAGKYAVEFAVRAPSKVTLQKASFHFNLSQADVDAVRRNMDVIKATIENILKAGIEGFSPRPENWTWRSIELFRST